MMAEVIQVWCRPQIYNPDEQQVGLAQAEQGNIDKGLRDLRRAYYVGPVER